jgi:hypothetical protein
MSPGAAAISGELGLLQPTKSQTHAAASTKYGFQEKNMWNLL